MPLWLLRTAKRATGPPAEAPAVRSPGGFIARQSGSLLGSVPPPAVRDSSLFAPDGNFGLPLRLHILSAPDFPVRGAGRAVSGVSISQPRRAVQAKSLQSGAPLRAAGSRRFLLFFPGAGLQFGPEMGKMQLATYGGRTGRPARKGMEYERISRKSELCGLGGADAGGEHRQEAKTMWPQRS